MLKRKIAKPVYVSYREPVVIDNKIKYWHVDVGFEGDIIGNFKNIKVPKLNRIYTWKYDQKSNVTSVFYSFKNDLLGIGAERAWRFRLKMLDAINQKKNENIK